MMKDYEKKYSICRGSFCDGTWYRKGFMTKLGALIAAAKESRSFDGKVYVHRPNVSRQDGRLISDVETIAIYRNGKKDLETMKILGMA